MSRIRSGSTPFFRSRRLARQLVAILACVIATPVLALTQVTGFGSNPGNLQMFKYVPSGLPANAPLVVAMHGCSQSASNYDDETGWQLLADRWQFALLLPQQQSSNNSSGCFNWFELGDITRGQGEALSIKQMVDRMISDHGSDTSRIYVTGLSAGGAMTAVMLATYPDVFAGGAILSGIPYRCATSQSAAFSCMNPGSDLSPSQWGDKVRAASSWSGPWPIVSVWHGDADYIVRPANLTESMEQWTNVNGVDQTADVSESIGGYPHKVYKDASGMARVETWSITGMGHGTPVDPGTGETQCGTAGAYILDVNLCSSYYIARFWGLDNLDGEPPVAVLTSPADGASVSGNVTITAGASDNVGVDHVEFLLDGSLLGSDVSAPYSMDWDSSTATDGDHDLQARAIDLAGNSGNSASITVTVSGGVGGGSGGGSGGGGSGGGSGGDPVTVSFSNEDANDGYVKANADGSSAGLGTLESWLGLAIGRGTDGKFNRALLSFDTSAIPDGATIVSAHLTVAYSSAYGNPWTNPAGNHLVIDVETGCYGACNLETGDWGASSTSNASAELLSFTGGNQTSTAFDAAGLSAINTAGRTQLRLRFNSNQTATNYIWIGHGSSATLEVTYQP